MAQLQDLVPGGQDDVWGDILEANLVSLNTELIETTQRSKDTAAALSQLQADLTAGVYGGGGGGSGTSGAPGTSENYHSTQNAARNPDVPRNWWLSDDGTVPTQYADGDILLVPPAGAAAPPKVTGLTSSNRTSNGATLSWSGALGADEYEVSYKKTADTTWVIAGRVTGLSYALTGLTFSTSYDTRVQGINEGGPGLHSDVHTFSTTAHSPYAMDTWDDAALGLDGWTAHSARAVNLVRDTALDAGGTAVVASIRWEHQHTDNTLGSAVQGKRVDADVNPNTAYVARAMVRHNDTVARFMSINILEYDAAGVFLATKAGAAVSVAPNTWTAVECAFTTGASTEQLRPYTSIHAGVVNNVLSNADNVYITRP